MLRKPWGPRPWPARAVLRGCALLLVLLALANVALWRDSQLWDVPALRRPVGGRAHPIVRLMAEARTRHEALVAARAHDLDAAAARYRTRRGRHPPPGFDACFRAAVNAKALVVEDFFDRIYRDLAPFWALDPDTLRTRASAWHFVVRVRGGKASPRGDAAPRGDAGGLVPWLQLWTDLVKEFAHHLPDVDMPINYMDEPRLVVPFDTVADLVGREARQRKMPSVDEVTGRFKGLKDLDEADPQPAPYDPLWLGPDHDYWSLAVQGCGSHTPAYRVKQVDKLSAPAQFPQHYAPSYAYKGFVRNWTAAMDPCPQPHMRQLHGTFVEPVSLSTSQELIPLFGGSKLAVNNEILIPGAMYLSDMALYSGGNTHGPPWARKKTGLIWRGTTSGGRAKAHSWHHFQRQRLVDMLNATSVSRLEAHGTRAMAFELPRRDAYPGWRLRDGQLSAWLEIFADAAFNHLCTPPDDCSFYNETFAAAGPVPMREQYRYKFLPDVDGNSFSARFRGFLRSTSLPLKATMYAEWYDDRLVPWLHFVPLDNTFQDLYSVLDFFGDGDGPGDMAARLIAERGREWSEAVLRRDDMRLYVWRLLLEWARVCDENRDTLGFVDDLRNK